MHRRACTDLRSLVLVETGHPDPYMPARQARPKNTNAYLHTGKDRDGDRNGDTHRMRSSLEGPSFSPQAPI